jgi:Sulfatase-modifying factor enzyme 1
MTRSSLILTVAVGVSAVVPSSLASAACPVDMVESGSTCIDKYEASIWTNFNAHCIQLIKQGANLPQSCIGVQVASSGSQPIPLPCKPDTGSKCTNIFALSKPGVIPATEVNYFTAAAACRNSGKRLPTNAEWQAAALGTPDPPPPNNPPCNLNSQSLATTGSHVSCVSDVKAFDMVGNVTEFVADWGPLATEGTNWGVLNNPVLATM